MRLLLVEDDFLIGDGTKKALEKEGFSVDWTECRNDALSALTTHQYDVVILDLRLPDGSGLDILRSVRAHASRIGVLVLTALGSTEDRVLGLDLGADDYLVKPFEFKELCARIRAIHRRRQGLASPQLVHGPLILNPSTHTATEDGRTLDLGAKEFSILKLLLERVGQVVTKADLEENIYAWGDEVSSNAVEVLIHRIRKKIKFDLIKTVRGVGYLVEELHA